MQKLLKKSNGFMLLCSLLFLILSVTGCQDVKLKAAIEIANKQCPMDIGEVGMITKIIYDGSNVVYTFNVNEESVNVKGLRESPEDMKESMMMMYQNPTKEVKELLKLVVKCKAGLQMNFIGKESGEKASIELTSDEIEKAINADMSASESDKSKLEAQVKIANLQFPMQVSEEVLIEKMELNDKSAIYICRVDEDLCDINQLKSNSKAVKEGITESLADQTDKSTQLFIKLCVNDNKSIVYRYIGNQPENALDIEITVDELKGMLKK